MPEVSRFVLPMKKCYRCETEITTHEALLVRAVLNVSEDLDLAVTDALGYIHMTKENGEFWLTETCKPEEYELAPPVTCQKCFWHSVALMEG